MNDQNKLLKMKVIHGLIWKLSERVGIQFVSLIVQIIIARLLLPQDYAIVAIITVFITIANTFVQSGLNSALIQKKETDELDYSSVFYSCLLLSIAFYLILFCFAPHIAAFYHETRLIQMLRIQAIILILGALSSIQYTLIIRKMNFKTSFFINGGGVMASGVTGIYMAFSGFGVWALVFSQLVNSLVCMVLMWIVIPWRPQRILDPYKVNTLFQFGWKLLCSSLLDTLYNNLRTLIIGKYFNKVELGYYDRGQALPQMLIGSVNGSISAVMFPAFSYCQDDLAQLKKLLRRSIIISCFFVFPAMIGLSATARSLIIIMLTEKWLGAEPFMQLCCITFLFWPIHTANLQAINALGRSDIFLKLEIIKKIIGLAIIFISMPFGIYALVGSGILLSVIATFINAYPNKKLLGYSYFEQIKDIAPSLVISLIMGLMVYSINWLGLKTWTTLILQVLAGLIIYVVMSRSFNSECFQYTIGVVNSLKSQLVKR